MESKSKAPAGSLTSQAIKKINELLSSGRLISGQKLIERDLCELLKMGRAPIREALRVLAGDGVIELIPGRGARVREMGAQQIADMLKVIIGLLFVALDELPSLRNKELFKAKLVEQNQRIKKAAQLKDPFALTDALYGYQEHIISSAENEYLSHTVKKAQFLFYTREVIRYINSMQAYATVDLYDEITQALIMDEFDVAKSLYAQTRDRLVAYLTDTRDF